MAKLSCTFLSANKGSAERARAYSAVCQILDYGFNALKLETVYALVKKENLAAKALGRRAGFKRILEYYSDAGRGQCGEVCVYQTDVRAEGTSWNGHQ